MFDNTLVELALLLGFTPSAHGDLNEDHFVRALHTQVLRVINEAIRRMFGNNLKMVFGRNGQSINHCLVHPVADSLAILRRSAAAEVDANEWPRKFSFALDAKNISPGTMASGGEDLKSRD